MKVFRFAVLILLITIPITSMVLVYTLPNEMIENTQFGGLLAAAYVLSSFMALYCYIIMSIKGDFNGG